MRRLDEISSIQQLIEEVQGDPARPDVQAEGAPSRRQRGIVAERVLTDNGNGYRSVAFRDAIAAAGLRHLRTRPRRPQTNAKAETFIGICLREWAYANTCRSSADRARALDGWLRWYNTRRPTGRRLA